MSWKLAAGLALGISALAMAAPGYVRADDAKKPNIVVIMGDDIGITNIGVYGHGMMAGKTPNLDRMAREGMMFTDYYAEASCTAGRAAFITGQLPIRTGMTTVGQAGATIGLPAEAVTTATVLKSMGYATGQFGKNHLGDRNAFLPTVHGFDEFFGYLYHLDAMEDPFHPGYPQALINQVGPRNLVHSWATDVDDPTEMPRWGRIGKQKIEDDGPLPPHPMPGIKYNMETVDEEFVADFDRLHGQGEDSEQAVLRLAQSDPDARRDASVAEVRGHAELGQRMDRTGSRHGRTRRQCRRGDAVPQGQGPG